MEEIKIERADETNTPTNHQTILKTSKPSWFSKLLKNFGPGFFIVGYVIGTGSVTSMLVSGSRYGLSISWALLASCILTYFLLIAISRLTILTGQTLMYNFRRRFGSGIVGFVVAGLSISIFSSCIGIMGVLSEVLVEWASVTFSISQLPKVLVALLLVALLIGLFWSGKHKFFIKTMSILVSIMAIAFVVTGIVSITQAPQPFIAYFPEISDNHIGLVIAGMVGTTMAGVCLVSRSILVDEEGWKVVDLKKDRMDSGIAMILTFVVSLAIMISATITLYFSGVEVNGAIDMINTLGPVAGELSLLVFALGILGAGLSSIFPNLLLFPWLISDYQGVKRNMHSRKNKILVVTVALSCLIVPVFGGKPIWILIASQAFSPFIMPLITLFLIILLNSKKVTKAYKTPIYLNIALVLALGFNLYMMWVAVTGYYNWLID
jgi:Mn2+/Fe2+ NRAMP family transporter